MVFLLGGLALGGLALGGGGTFWAIVPPNTVRHDKQERFTRGSPAPVVGATVERGDMPMTVEALGTVTPLATVTIRTQISGQLMRVAFEEGQNVDQGNLLAEIDPRPYEVALGQWQGQLLRDEALLDNARIDLARYERLAKQHAIAQQQAGNQRYLVAQYEGALKSDKAQVETAKLNLLYCRITAPVTGRIGLRRVDQGNYIQPTDVNGIAVITQMNPISVIFMLPEDDLPALVKRLHEGHKVKVSAFDSGNAIRLAAGGLEALDNEIDIATGTVKVRAVFGNGGQTLFPNQFVNIHVALNTLRDVAIVPASAIRRSGRDTFVYVVKPDDSVAVRPVQLGPTKAGRTVIERGLAIGDTVVTEGADELHDGAKVTVLKSTAGLLTSSAIYRGVWPDRACSSGYERC
ncbi:MAG TPA: MdtA/MuxA family multidrug efflux RND transporter periplasmic adaptor subunit [Stellaceae bacterium]|nr:MdtA/MuxA family multidrug efflux RND transporter periplasmic adaptor subunit [Stellaceae bacterium]